jgi:hypothetical protein
MSVPLGRYNQPIRLKNWCRTSTHAAITASGSSWRGSYVPDPTCATGIGMSVPLGRYNQPIRLKNWCRTSTHAAITASASGYPIGESSSGMCSKFIP